MSRPDDDLGPLRADLLLASPTGIRLGAQRIALLEAIARHGSIAQAARAVAMSYKTAWDAVDDMNTLAGEPLVHCRAGGAQGGRSTLTARGERLIALYRTLDTALQQALRRQHHPG